MTLASVQKALKPLGLLDRIIFFEKDATPTVADAARLLGCEPRLIAKTMAVKLHSGPALIVLAGDARVEGKKFRKRFQESMKFSPSEALLELTGHGPGSMTPIGAKQGVPIYFDASLRSLPELYPAGGTAETVVRLTLTELEKAAPPDEWVDLAREGE